MRHRNMKQQYVEHSLPVLHFLLVLKRISQQELASKRVAHKRLFVHLKPAQAMGGA